MKACDYIVHYLHKQAGLRHIFSYAGGTNAMLMDAMVRHGDIKIVPMRHEENAALAADGYAKVKKGLSFAMAMSGPRCNQYGYRYRAVIFRFLIRFLSDRQCHYRYIQV